MIKRLTSFSPQQLFVFKYSLLIITIFLMIVSIRTYVNYVTVIQSIEDTKHQIQQLEQHMAYMQTIEKPYLQSQRALTFLAHESNKRLPGEKLIQIITFEGRGSGEGLLLTGGLGSSGDRSIITGGLSYTRSFSSPQEARAVYLRELLGN